MPRDEARRTALVESRGITQATEAVREQRRLPWLDNTGSDVRYALRSLRHSPAFATVVVLTLALGIGATTGIFSVVSGVLLTPLPYPESDRLVSVWGRFLPESGFDFPIFPVAPPEYLEYRAQSRTMEDVAAYNTFGATVIQPSGAALPTRGAAVAANLFDVLHVSPAIGRTPSAAEAVHNGPAIAVLGHGLWQRAFGGDSALIGRTIRVNSQTVEVIGVMPEGFAFPSKETELWTPLAIDPETSLNRAAHFLLAVGRLRDGASFDAADREMAALMRQWQSEFPDVHTGHFLFLQPLLDTYVGNARPALLAVMGAVALVMLLVCANVVNLLLARGQARQRELAVRSALGASRMRLVRQFLIEGAVLSVIGGLAGLALAYLVVDLTSTFGGDAIPRASTIGVNARALLFTGAVALFTTVIFAAAPALGLEIGVPRRSLREDDRASTSGAGGLRLRHTLVAIQVALAVIVAIGAALTIRSFGELTAVDPGFRAEQVLVARLALPSGDYPESGDVLRAYEQLTGRLSSLPGARSATAVSTLPLGGNASNNDFVIEGRLPAAPGEPATSGDMIVADPGYTETMGVDLVEGRFFEAGDRIGGLPVAVVNRRAAGMFWPGESAIGKRIRIARDAEVPWLTIVGVVEDVQFRTLADEARPAWYMPLAQMPLSLGQPLRTFTVAVRGQADPAVLAPAVRSTVEAIDPSLPLIGMRPMQRVVAESVDTRRFTMTLLGFFAALALVLGAIGIYGVLAYAVARRTREFGIRVALGAGRRQVMGIVLAQGLRIVAVGVVVGVAGALAASRVMTGLLFRVSATDPATYAAIAAMVCGIAIVACLVPLWRALRVDPVLALRAE
jgi:putative ABC transport system permease protein